MLECQDICLCQNYLMISFQDVKMSECQHIWMSKCQEKDVWISLNVKMSAFSNVLITSFYRLKKKDVKDGLNCCCCFRERKDQ